MKSFLKKIYDKLKSPNGLVLTLSYLGTVIFIAVALTMLSVDYEGSALAAVAYTSYALAALFLAYTVYTLIVFAPSFKSRISDALNANEITRRLIHNWGARTVLGASITFIVGIAYSVFNGVLGIVHSSIWYGALAAYYIFLVLTRGRLLLGKRKTGTRNSELAAARDYRNSGILMLILNAALSSAIAQMIFDGRGFEYKDWIIYAFAAYAFYKISLAVYNVVKARRQEDMRIRAIREINLVDAAVSILALQTALLHTFATDGAVDISLFNTLTGSAVSLFAISLSIYMIIDGNRLLSSLVVSKGEAADASEPTTDNQDLDNEEYITPEGNFTLEASADKIDTNMKEEENG